MDMGWWDAFAFVRAESRRRNAAARLSLIIARAAESDPDNFKKMLSALEDKS